MTKLRIIIICFLIIFLTRCGESTKTLSENELIEAIELIGNEVPDSYNNKFEIVQFDGRVRILQIKQLQCNIKQILEKKFKVVKSDKIMNSYTYNAGNGTLIDLFPGDQVGCNLFFRQP